MNGWNSSPRVAIATATLTTLGLLGTLGLAGCTTPAALTGTAHEHTAMAMDMPASTSAMDMSSMDMSSIDMTTHRKGAVSAQIALHTAMANLWAQHMEWTYATVIAFVQDSPALTPTMNRLLQNQSDIGNAIKPFYGDEAGDQLIALLEEHINDAVPVLTSAKAGDADALNAAVEAWYANAQAIADFLAAANPHWKQADMEEMMAAHITQTIAYATDALGGDYAAAIADYGIAEQHMAQMADMLSAGIIKQFPKQFK